MRYRLSIICWALLFGSVLAQRPIELKNPSFENGPKGAGITPGGWINLGSTYDTPPDVQPGYYSVTMPAQDGEHYLGLVVRSTNSWEGVGQQLTDYLKKDSTYVFSLWLARSNAYSSMVLNSGTNELVNFQSPTILKIWGFNTRTQKEELLAETEAIGHSKWVKYSFELTPHLADYDEIDLMAYYAPGYEQQNGHILMDNCSKITLKPR